MTANRILRLKKGKVPVRLPGECLLPSGAPSQHTIPGSHITSVLTQSPKLLAQERRTQKHTVWWPGPKVCVIIALPFEKQRNLEQCLFFLLKKKNKTEHMCW